MTDSQLLIGIIENDERAWRYIYHNMRIGFASILVQAFTDSKLRKEDIKDIFQESLVVLMQKVKRDGLMIPRECAIFSYLVEIGKRTACNFLRKQSHISPADGSTYCKPSTAGLIFLGALPHPFITEVGRSHPAPGQS